MSVLDALGPTLPRLARDAIVEWLSGGGFLAEAAGGSIVDPAQGPVFVSLLSSDGALRGCMGFWSSGGGRPTRVTAATVRAAVLAAVHDPRFPPVAAPELARLRVSVAVATSPLSVASAADVDPAVHGVIVQGTAGRQGSLMPGLPGVRDGAHLVQLAREKAGIDADAAVTLRSFTVATWADGGNLAAHPGW